MVAPLYISEISPPEIRGSLLVLEEFSIVLGIVIAFWITYGTQYIPSEWAWVSFQSHIEGYVVDEIIMWPLTAPSFPSSDDPGHHLGCRHHLLSVLAAMAY